MRAAGADGCRGGWICLTRAASGPIEAFLAATVDQLIACSPPPDVLAIDVPIGLPDVGPRRCDEEARRLLGPRRSSVFPAPLRPVLAESSWAAASDARHRIEGKRMSRQAWGIVAKVREVDALLGANPGLRRRVREVHPELSFAAWNGTPMLHGKRRAAGRGERRRLVDRGFGRNAFAEVRRAFRRGDVGDDDVLDAFAALWSAERVLRGEARVVPDPPPVDTAGLVMEIVF